MAHVVVMGGGLGGIQAAYEMRRALGEGHQVTLVSALDHFQFTPSNPWVAVGWREPEDVQVPLRPYMERRGVHFIPVPVARIEPGDSRLLLEDGQQLAYDYLIITTGPRLAFEEVPGLGPDGHTHSICTTPHARRTWEAYEAFLKDPGPIVVGAVQAASCFGPAYEFAMILDTDLRRRKLRHKVPMTFVTSEPYVGHMGLGGVGDSKGLLESEFRQRDIKWIANARVDQVAAESVDVSELDAQGAVLKTHALPQRFSMFIPAFRGVAPVAAVADMCNPRGFVLIDDYQRNPRYPNVFSAGVCVAIPPVESTPVPTGAPKTGFMIESMVTAIVHNIKAELEGQPADNRATWNAVCLADTGSDGIAFVALPQIPPRNVTWATRGKWVHLAKIAFERYFLHKVKSGNTEPVYEKYVMEALGIERLQKKE